MWIRKKFIKIAEKTPKFKKKWVFQQDFSNKNSLTINRERNLI